MRRKKTKKKTPVKETKLKIKKAVLKDREFHVTKFIKLIKFDKYGSLTIRNKDESDTQEFDERQTDQKAKDTQTSGHIGTKGKKYYGGQKVIDNTVYGENLIIESSKKLFEGKPIEKIGKDYFLFVTYNQEIQVIPVQKVWYKFAPVRNSVSLEEAEKIMKKKMQEKSKFKHKEEIIIIDKRGAELMEENGESFDYNENNSDDEGLYSGEADTVHAGNLINPFLKDEKEEEEEEKKEKKKKEADKKKDKKQQKIGKEKAKVVQRKGKKRIAESQKTGSKVKKVKKEKSSVRENPSMTSRLVNYLETHTKVTTKELIKVFKLKGKTPEAKKRKKDFKISFAARTEFFLSDGSKYVVLKHSKN